jgi:hypothetical protein
MTFPSRLLDTSSNSSDTSQNRFAKQSLNGEEQFVESTF